MADKAKLGKSGDVDAGHGAVECCWGPCRCIVWPGRSLVFLLCFDSGLVKMLVVLIIGWSQKRTSQRLDL